MTHGFTVQQFATGLNTVRVFELAEANFHGKVHFRGLYKRWGYFEFAEMTAENH
jgi:hypothetical protein